MDQILGNKNYLNEIKIDNESWHQSILFQLTFIREYHISIYPLLQYFLIGL